MDQNCSCWLNLGFPKSMICKKTFRFSTQFVNDNFICVAQTMQHQVSLFITWITSFPIMNLFDLAMWLLFCFFVFLSHSAQFTPISLLVLFKSTARWSRLELICSTSNIDVHHTGLHCVGAVLYRNALCRLLKLILLYSKRWSYQRIHWKCTLILLSYNEFVPSV